jgi:hypothetical protein
LDFNETSIFSTDFRKIKLTNFIKFRPMEVALFHPDRRTDGHDENEHKGSKVLLKGEACVSIRSVSNTLFGLTEAQVLL